MPRPQPERARGRHAPSHRALSHLWGPALDHSLRVTIHTHARQRVPSIGSGRRSARMAPINPAAPTFGLRLHAACATRLFWRVGQRRKGSAMACATVVVLIVAFDHLGRHPIDRPRADKKRGNLISHVELLQARHGRRHSPNAIDPRAGKLQCLGACLREAGRLRVPDVMISADQCANAPLGLPCFTICWQ